MSAAVDDRVDPTEPKVVRIGSRVTYREEGGRDAVARLRGGEQRQADDISANSPLGDALLGHKVGDEVVVSLTHVLARKVTIVRID